MRGEGWAPFYVVPWPAWTQSAIRYAVPLGCRCCTASFLEKFQIRKFAGPFDWMFSCPRMVAHCLRDEFRSFLNPSLYVLKDYRFDSIGPEGQLLAKPRQRNLIGHQLYSDWMCGVGHGTLFNHRDPLHEEEDYKYMSRAVQRFQRILQSRDRKLFTILNFDSELWAEQYILDLFHALLTKTSNFDLVAVNCWLNQGQVSSAAPLHMITYGDARLLQYHLSCFGNSTGKDFTDERDVYRIKTLLIDPYQFEIVVDPLKQSEESLVKEANTAAPGIQGESLQASFLTSPLRSRCLPAHSNTTSAPPPGTSPPCPPQRTPKTSAAYPRYSSTRPTNPTGSPTISQHAPATRSAQHAKKRMPTCSTKKIRKWKIQSKSTAFA